MPEGGAGHSINLERLSRDPSYRRDKPGLDEGGDRFFDDDDPRVKISELPSRKPGCVVRVQSGGRARLKLAFSIAIEWNNQECRFAHHGRPRA